MADVAKSIGAGHDILAVVHHGKISMSQRMELVTQKNSMGFLVHLAQIVDGDVESTSVLIGLHGKREDVVRDGAVQPAPHTAILLYPLWVIGVLSSAINMMHEYKLAHHFLEEGDPLVEVGFLHLQVDGDVRFDADCCEWVDVDGWSK